MRSKDGQHYPAQKVPGKTEEILGHPIAEDEQADQMVLTEDGALAIDGGKLPGNVDDFEGEIDEHARPVPGAFGEVHPPDLGMTDMNRDKNEKSKRSTET